MLRQKMKINRGTKYIKKSLNKTNSTNTLKSYYLCDQIKMMDKHKLSDDLTMMNIMHLYDFMNPIDYLSDITAKSINSRKSTAIKHFQTDRIFNARVEHIVAHTMNLIENQIERGKN